MRHPDKIYNVSKTQLSIARHYGGITYNGVYYVYNPADDTLTKVERKKPSIRKPKETEADREKWRNANPGLDL